MQKSARFDDRFLAKLNKIDRQEIETFLGNVVREKNFLQIVFQSMLDGVLVLRPNLEVVYLNESAANLLNISTRRRIVGEPLSRLISTPEILEMLARFVIDNKPVQQSEVVLPAPTEKIFQITLIPLDNDSQYTGSLVMILHDMTEARRSEQARNKAERATILARLTASLAHEIKNPLNSLQIHAQLLQRGLNAPKRTAQEKERLHQSIEIIVEEIRRLSGVLDHFLKAVRPTQPLLKPIDLNRLLDHVALMMTPECEGLGVQIRVVHDYELPLIKGDPDQLTQAMVNLVKNAKEAFTLPGNSGEAVPWNSPDGREAVIELRTGFGEEFYWVSVADNGPGIPQQNLGEILEPYYTTKFHGSGLGLTIVTRIVEEHGGHLDIDSRPGKGTIFRLSFPLEQKGVRRLPEGPSAGSGM